MLEVMIDQLAVELDMDPLELRRKNFIAPGDFPYTTPYGITYDSGDYETAFDMALDILDLDAFRAEQASLRAPIRTVAIWSRPWWQTIMFSERVSIHFSGWPSFLEAAQSRTSSP